MPFRIEQKYRINKYKLPYLYSWIGKNNGEKIYLDRFIHSIYFDNYKLSLYHESVEGLVPRKKIRLRSYQKNINKFENSKLETKINSVEGRYKESKKADSPLKILRNGILDNKYGLLFPTVQISYQREYYKIFNIRITIDTKIKYKKYNRNFINRHSYDENDVILEAKSQTKDISMYNYIDENIFFEKIRFSKYCNAIEKVFFVNWFVVLKRC